MIIVLKTKHITEGAILLNIIAELNRKITTHMTTCLDKALEENSGLTGMVESTLQLVREMGRDILEELIESLEESLLSSDERKEEWTIHSRNREKKISTLLGDISYNRTYYRNRKTGDFRHLVDDLLDIEPHSRIDTGLKADMLDKAKEMSYEQVVRSYDDISISTRSTVKNVVHSTSMAGSNWPSLKSDKKKVRFLHVEADEDHVHQQKGKGMIMKLAYVHEGKSLVNPFSATKNHRYELIGAQYMTGLYPKNDDFWFEVLDYLDNQYDLDSVERVFLSGDGAPWIRAGKDILPKCSFVIDGYHLSKYIKTATASYKGWEKKLKNYVYSGNREMVEAYFDTIEGNDHTEAELKRLGSCRTYILGNWDEVQSRSLNGYVECSAEGHVSHILSHRLSSRPISWSRKGSENVAKLRVYTRNGGSIRGLLENAKVIQMKDKVQVRVNKTTLKNRKKSYEEFSNNITILDIGKRTNAYKFLKSIRSA